MESINQVDEAKLLGYFETTKSVFLLKFILLVSFTKEQNGTRSLDVAKLPADAIAFAQNVFDFPLFYKALVKDNEELCANFHEDMVTTALTSSWLVFEQLIKDLNKQDYATSAENASMTYQSGKFQFDARKKKDLDLFYYIRNAIQHYNGAYHVHKDIDHRFAGTDFKSIGHHGEKIEVNIQMAWQIVCTLEQYAMEAWKNAKTFTQKP